MRTPIFVKEQLDVIIVSPGGVGTTFFMNEVGKYLSTNSPDNLDGLKHIPIPPFIKNKTKVIYIFGNPIYSVISLFRRNYHQVQSYQMQKYKKVAKVIPVEMTIQQYARERFDGMCFDEHFYNWEIKYPFYETLFLHYDAIYDQLDRVQEFLDLPSSFVDNFIEKRQRTSSTEDLKPETLELLNAKYHDFSTLVNNKPKIFDRKSLETPMIFKLYFDAQYRKAFHNHLMNKLPFLRKGLNNLKR